MKMMIISIFIFIADLSFGQSKINDKDAPGAKYNCLYGSLGKRSFANAIKLPFNSVEIIDARADTSKIGFFYSNSALKMMKLCYKKGLATEVNNFYTNSLQQNFTSSNQSLVISIRKH